MHGKHGCMALPSWSDWQTAIGTMHFTCQAVAGTTHQMPRSSFHWGIGTGCPSSAHGHAAPGTVNHKTIIVHKVQEQLESARWVGHNELRSMLAPAICQLLNSQVRGKRSRPLSETSLASHVAPCCSVINVSPAFTTYAAYQFKIGRPLSSYAAEGHSAPYCEQDRQQELELQSSLLPELKRHRPAPSCCDGCCGYQ